MHKYYVYILTNASQTLYVGVTGNLARRMFQHKAKRIKGFTKRYNIDRLVYLESFWDVHEAIRREKQIKGWRRSKRIELIESINPGWKDLSWLMEGFKPSEDGSPPPWAAPW